MNRAVVVAALLYGACQSGDNDFPISTLSSQEIVAACQRAVRCGLEDVETVCETTLTPTDLTNPAVLDFAADPGVAAGVNAGKLDYDPVVARACVDAIAALSCDRTAEEVRVAPDACTTMVQGHVTEGDPCTFDQECDSGRCSPPDICGDDYTCCFGVCASPPHTADFGNACMIDSDCAVEAFCSGAGCHALLAETEACSLSTQCDYGLACLGRTGSTSGTCKTPPVQGEPCPDGFCGDIGSVCGSDGTCDPIGHVGAACRRDHDCHPSLVCDPTALTCANAPDVGETCQTTCKLGAFCSIDATAPDGTPGTCVVSAADNAQCEFPEQCLSNYCAEGQFATTCVERPVCF